MAFRKKMTNKKSRKDFRRKSGQHKRNVTVTPMRGGYRL